MRDLTRPLFTIGIVSGLIGVSPATLRAWEARGLLSPQRDRRTGRRLYSWRDVERLQYINFLVSKRRVPIGGVKSALRRSAGASTGEWVIDRRRPRSRRGAPSYEVVHTG
ncbi:MAG: MerR family transcriptional regulator [Armatimonadetes bacterium]|nr:MerR family transcriptional regulator [Armatimonadota bacterium]